MTKLLDVSFSSRLRARVAGGAAAVVTLCVPLAGVAHANLLNIGGSCPATPTTQAFAQWGDPSYYELVHGGDFEASLAGWRLSGGAQKTSGSETYGVSGTVGNYSLSLPSGATALSPATCVTAAYPYFRFFDRSATDGSGLRVEVVYRDLLGLVTTLLTPSNGISPSGSWQPTDPMTTASAVPSLLGAAQLQLRFTGLSGTSQIDDVYVDPHGRG
jgi:hypothetical protein